MLYLFLQVDMGDKGGVAIDDEEYEDIIIQQ